MIGAWEAIVNPDRKFNRFLSQQVVRGEISNVLNMPGLQDAPNFDNG